MGTTPEDLERRAREIEARDWLHRTLWWEITLTRHRAGGAGATTEPRRVA
jgi:hypothetical protein